MLLKAISAMGMGGVMVASLVAAARMRYMKPKPGDKSTPKPAGVSVPTGEGLRHTDWKIRLNAVNALETALDDAVLPDLVNLLNDADPEVREAAARVAEKYGGRAVDGLAEVLQTGNLDARTLAAKALGSIGDAAAVPALIEALKDHSVWVRVPVVQALGKIKDSRAVEALAQVRANDHEADVKIAATKALRDTGTPEALAALRTHS